MKLNHSKCRFNSIILVLIPNVPKYLSQNICPKISVPKYPTLIGASPVLKIHLRSSTDAVAITRLDVIGVLKWPHILGPIVFGVEVVEYVVEVIGGFIGIGRSLMDGALVESAGFAMLDCEMASMSFCC